MPDDVPRLPWTDEQWAALQRIVQEAAAKARVASSFLPLVGPVPPGQASVPALVMEDKPKPVGMYGPQERLEINDAPTLSFVTAECQVHLTTQQVEDPELESAKQLLARAADIVARLEDAVVFNGEATPGTYVKGPRVWVISGGQRPEPALGLLDCNRQDFVEIDRKDGSNEVDGEKLVSALVEAIEKIEGHGHYGPFACVLGHDLFQAANTPDKGSLVLPSDRIVSFLDGGAFRRSSVVPSHEGIVVGLAGSPVDLVVARDVHVKFLQMTLEPRYVLRVSERFVLRIKQPQATCLLTSPPAEVPPAEVPPAEVPPAEVPGAKVPGAKVPGAKVPGAKVPGAKAPADKTSPKRGSSGRTR